ncbi:NAD-dependent aldehyde dehydrogenase [Aequorivita sublithincola DSM 14238]|uniref:NAD-dependent aldehyde dehydrogenase n=1 Tax=Aequorivita sublithincola (strain DSM 14238 / LMG 21431 / ACAM 643 / 9-3) TaxID=746697 RepID=I3YZ12_AEQSU|nr:acyl-CoA reductase [Aequorivita sublithincola]AFL82230.1 NAD-dependent aldehyde dehydrogenase [Aequorivita sublithincola DSM 14238]
MQIKDRINAFVKLGKFLREIKVEDEIEDEIEMILRKAEAENGWFTQENIKFTLKSWGEALSKENLQQWVSNYDIEETEPKQVAIIMAGNIPLVGFHDFLSVLITGNKVLAKLSSNDKTLLPFLAKQLISIEPEFKNYIELTEGRLKDFDAVIATGSNNTARYFDYYFGKYPNIIRKNRNSVAVLTGNETKEDLKNLADDIFTYFGLGCRNVSKIYIPEDYDFEPFFKGMFSWKEIIHNHKYINNYDYNKAVYLMDSFPLLDNEFMLLKEDSGFSSPISVVFFERYTSKYAVKKMLEAQSENIQCLVTKAGLPNEIPFGKAQNPELWDYADGVDTVDFLLKIH